MNLSLAEKLIADCVAVQTRWDNDKPLPAKLLAKVAGFKAISEHVETGSRILDIGGEDFYHDLYEDYDVVTLNLPADMHNGIEQDDLKYDAVLAMHVLEHSPFPLYVLALIARALKPCGYVWIALPTHTTAAFSEIDQHFTVMPSAMWERLFKAAKLVVLEHDIGKFGNTADWVEERYLCQKM